MFLFLHFGSNSTISSAQKINNLGNRAAIAALFISGIFSIILALVIVRSLIKLRDSIFPINRTFYIKVEQNNDGHISATKDLKSYNPKFNFYSTYIAFILLLAMFSIMTVIFFKSAFDLLFIGNQNNRYLKIHKVWSIIPILMALLCFFIAVIFTFKLIENLSNSRVKRDFCMTYQQDMKSMKDMHEIKKEDFLLKNFLWYLIEILSIFLCIATIIICIYFAYSIII